MKLYHCPGSRSVRPRWLLEELEVPYELEVLDVFKGEGRTAVYHRIHPLGAVPAMWIDGMNLIEAGAICMYLTDQFGDRQFAPPLNTPERGRYYQWMFFVPATMEPPLMNVLTHTRFLPEARRLPQVAESAAERFRQVAKVLDTELIGQPYILGDDFSTADIMIASTLQWIPELVEPFAALEEYRQRLTQRPAYRRACAN